MYIPSAEEVMEYRDIAFQVKELVESKIMNQLHINLSDLRGSIQFFDNYDYKSMR